MRQSRRLACRSSLATSLFACGRNLATRNSRCSDFAALRSVRCSSTTHQAKSRYTSRCNAFVDGNWISSSKTIDVANPSTGESIGKVPMLNQDEINDAITAAYEAFPDWSMQPPSRRAQILNDWYNLINANIDDIAHTMSLENGKPLAESKGEVAYANSFIKVFSEECTRMYGRDIPVSSSLQVSLQRQPVGVVAAITPWNFPAAMITRKVGAALGAGCTVVLKPSEFTPFTALALADLWHQAGGPKGTFNVLTSNAELFGGSVMNDTRISKITFTGSTRVGKIIMTQAAQTVKKMSMELGGNAPFIVFEDADIESAVKGIIAAKFRNCGQACVSANRIYVNKSVQDKVIEKLLAAINNMVVGDAFDSRSVIGPLINKNAVKKVQEHVDDAIAKGATLLCGGKVALPHASNAVPENHNSLFYLPTLVVNAKENMKCFLEETFGPVAFVYSFENEQEVLHSSNNTRAGLAAYFYTSNEGRIARLTSRNGLQYGMIAVNHSSVSLSVAPFGGIKESGFGREGGCIGLDDYLEYKTIHRSVPN